jgi:hypothetical protein
MCIYICTATNVGLIARGHEGKLQPGLKQRAADLDSIVSIIFGSIS